MRVKKESRISLHEDQLQVQCVSWFKLQYPQYEKRIWHPANGGFRNVIEAVRLKKMGVLPGVCDLIISIPNKDYGGLFCELKVENRKLSKNQENFINEHEGAYKIHVIRSLEEFQKAVDDYLKS